MPYVKKPKVPFNRKLYEMEKKPILPPRRVVSVPPKSWSQAIAFRTAYRLLRAACEGNLHRGFHSVQEVCDYLNNEIRFCPENPIQPATIKRWMRMRNFPAMSGRRRKDFFTTNLHVLAFLHTYRDYEPKRAYEAPETPMEAKL